MQTLEELEKEYDMGVFLAKKNNDEKYIEMLARCNDEEILWIAQNIKELRIKTDIEYARIKMMTEYEVHYNAMIEIANSTIDYIAPRVKLIKKMKTGEGNLSRKS